MTRTLGIMAAAALLALWPASALGQNHAPAPRTPHFMGASGLARGSSHHSKPGGSSSASDMTYGGGPVETAPSVYIDYWGSAWATGFSTGGYTSAQAQAYVQGFLSNVGGSSWANISSQYCQGVALNTVAPCAAGSQFVGNPAGQLAGVWNDTVDPVPANGYSITPVWQESLAAVAHFGYHANATYMVLSPSGDSQSGFGVGWCAYHDAAYYNGNQSYPYYYAYIPYQPDAGSKCGENFVNRKNDSWGNGYFDGFSMVAGHEYAEAETDPAFANGGNYAWTNTSGSEIGDLCVWNVASTNITLPDGHFYAVQPLWSDAVAACVLAYP